MSFFFWIKIYVWQSLTVVAVTVILILSLVGAYHAGQGAAASEVVLANAQSLTQGLKYFSEDQNRFPTELEFSQAEVMSQYFTVWPPQDIISKQCSQNFIYRRPSAGNYQLNFCLEKPRQSFPGGWNKLTGTLK